MLTWKTEEINKYKNKKVSFQNMICKVKEVFWLENEERFTFYIEDENKKPYKVYESDIFLL